MYVAALPPRARLKILELRLAAGFRWGILEMVQAQNEPTWEKCPPVVHALVVVGDSGIGGGVDTPAVSEGVEEAGVAATMGRLAAAVRFFWPPLSFFLYIYLRSV